MSRAHVLVTSHSNSAYFPAMLNKHCVVHPGVLGTQPKDWISGPAVVKDPELLFKCLSKRLDPELWASRSEASVPMWAQDQAGGAAEEKQAEGKDVDDKKTADRLEDDDVRPWKRSDAPFHKPFRVPHMMTRPPLSPTVGVGFAPPPVKTLTAQALPAVKEQQKQKAILKYKAQKELHKLQNQQAFLKHQATKAREQAAIAKRAMTR